MRSLKTIIGASLGLAAAVAMAAGAIAAETPKRGGILKFVVGSKIPSYDAQTPTPNASTRTRL
jgi:hypothetical protein